MAGEISVLEQLELAIDKLHPGCESPGCVERGAAAITCRQRASGCLIVCSAHLARVEKAIAAIGHFHCSECGEAGACLAEVATVTEF